MRGAVIRAKDYWKHNCERYDKERYVDRPEVRAQSAEASLAKLREAARKTVSYLEFLESDDIGTDEGKAVLDALRSLIDKTPDKKFPYLSRVEKIKGSSWRGRVVGFYSTSLTPDGYCVESENEPGSVQIYPENALRSLLDEPKAALAALAQPENRPCS